jgi:hypothetical protein
MHCENEKESRRWRENSGDEVACKRTEMRSMRLCMLYNRETGASRGNKTIFQQRINEREEWESINKNIFLI